MKPFYKKLNSLDSTLAKGKDFNQSSKKCDYEEFVWIQAINLCDTPISLHAESIKALAKVHKMKNVIVTSDRIIATHKDFDILIKLLINSIYLN